MSQADQLDWFDLDDEDLVNNLKTKLDTSDSPQGHIEFIEASAALPIGTETHAVSAQPTGKKFSTAQLRTILQMNKQNVFLFVFTSDCDFLSGQITSNDSVDRIFQYMKIMGLVLKLEVPGYDELILQSIAENEQLIELFVKISKIVFLSKKKSIFADINNVDAFLSNMETIFLSIPKVRPPSKHFLKVISEISMLIRCSNAESIVEHKSCISLKNTLDMITNDLIGDHWKETDEIFPRLEELLSKDDKDLEEFAKTLKNIIHSKSYQSSYEYIIIQKHLLREDFMIPLREYVQVLKSSQKACSLDTLFMENVLIYISENLMESSRGQFLVVDVIGTSRAQQDQDGDMNEVKLKINTLKNLKFGSLLCFTTSLDFENLILATVSYMDQEMLSKGQLIIDIVKQYNIGPIFNKEFIMFEGPAFFEPYNNVYNVLNTYGNCEKMCIPMQEYIVAGNNNPKYLQQTSLTSCGPNKNEVTKLNKFQGLALEDAISKEFCLIQGPPGTGKTHLSVALVSNLIKKTNSPIVLVTYTNESLDKFLLKLTKFTNSIVRFGIGSKNPELYKYNIKNINPEPNSENALIKKLYYNTCLLYKEDFGALLKQYEEFDGTDESLKKIVKAQTKLKKTTLKVKTIKIFFKWDLVKTKQVIAMTTTCAAKMNFLFKLLESPTVIFEEAAEILESHVLACMTNFTQHVIMIGDHMQLQPYTSSYQHSREYEMNISLFERLIQRGMRTNNLVEQYRMRPEIVKFICPVIYNTLKNAKCVEQYAEVRGLKKNVFFVSHNSAESHDQQSRSKYNTFECEKLIQLIKFLITKKEYDAEEIIILSPYIKQIELISKQLRKYDGLCKIKAATVDSFQGNEADIVLLSLVRSNDFKDIGFLGQKNRVCVALSRAKIGLYIIGNMTLLSACSNIWKGIEAQLEAQEAIGAEFPYA